MTKEQKEELLVLTAMVGAFGVVLSADDVLDALVEHAPEMADDVAAWRKHTVALAERVAEKARAIVGLEIE